MGDRRPRRAAARTRHARARRGPDTPGDNFTAPARSRRERQHAGRVPLQLGRPSRRNAETPRALLWAHRSTGRTLHDCGAEPRTPRTSMRRGGRLERSGSVSWSAESLLLDYPRNRLAILPDSEPLSATIAARARFTEVVLDPSRVLIPLRLGDEVVRRTVLDPALTPCSDLDHAGSLAGGDGTPRRRTGEPDLPASLSRWQSFIFVGAPAAGPVSLGGVNLGRPEVVFLRDGPASARLESWPEATDAVVGNRLFADRFLLVLDLPKRRLGLVDGKTARRQDGKTARRQDGKTARRQDGKTARSQAGSQLGCWLGSDDRCEAAHRAEAGCTLAPPRPYLPGNPRRPPTQHEQAAATPPAPVR